MVISGSGEMTNWKQYDDAQWYKYRKNLKKVIITDGVTTKSCQ